MSPSDSYKPLKHRWPMIVVGLLGIVGLIWAAVVFLKVPTSEGTIIIEIDQPELAGAVVSVDGEKKITIKTGEGKEPIVIVADKKTHTLKVTNGDFETFTKEFSIKAGGEQTIRVRLVPLPSPPLPATNNDPHRRVVEMLLRQGVKPVPVLTHTGAKMITTLEELPQRFALIKFYGQTKNGPFSGEDWNALKGVKYLWRVEITKPISPIGLTTLGEIGFIHHLELVVTELSDAGVAHVSGLTDLHTLSLSRNPGITDASCDVLLNMTQLRELNIKGTGITGAGLKRLTALTSLHSLTLSLDKGITAANLADLNSMKSLQSLTLGGLDVKDDVIEHVGKLKSLRLLWLKLTGMSDEGVARLQRLLPDCSVVHPSLPTAVADRTAAQCVVDNGGGIGGIGISHNRTPGKKLPENQFVLSNITIYTPKVASNLNALRSLNRLALYYLTSADLELENVGKLTTLTNLSLQGSDVADVGLKHLKGLSQLEILSLNACNKVSDDALVHLTGFKHLWQLTLKATQITDEGLVHLGKLLRLRNLSLESTQIIGGGLKHLIALPRLRILNLRRSPVTDDAIVHLQQMKSLRILSVSHTKITADGAKKLQAALPDCVVFHESLEDVPWEPAKAERRSAATSPGILRWGQALCSVFKPSADSRRTWREQ